MAVCYIVFDSVQTFKNQLSSEMLLHSVPACLQLWRDPATNENVFCLIAWLMSGHHFITLPPAFFFFFSGP